jgi:hypothetical protein
MPATVEGTFEASSRSAPRLACLVGNGDYEANDFPNLPTITKDLKCLERAMRRSGYEIRTYGGDEHQRLSSGQVKHAFEAACRDAPEGGVLFLYFSGHGVRHENGHDYIVPGDVPSLESAIDYPEDYLVSTDISRYLGRCKAETIVLALDACREGIASGKKALVGLRVSKFGDGEISLQQRQRVVTIYGCSRTEYCYYSVELGMSLFTSALCTVLDPKHEARTVDEVRHAVDTELQQLVSKYYPRRTQRVHLLHEDGPDSALDRVISNGTPDPWRKVATTSPMWKRVMDTEDGVREGLQAAVASIASEAWVWRCQAHRTVPNNPWRDDGFPSRCLRALDLLLPAKEELSTAEAAILTAAPFIREAVMASGVVRAGLVHPLDVQPHDTPDTLRRELEAIHQAYPRVTARAWSLPPDRRNERDALAIWLLYRSLLRQIDLWQQDAITELLAFLALALETRKGLIKQVQSELRALALSLSAELEQMESGLGNVRLRDVAEFVTPSGGLQTARETALGLLLHVSWRMSFDSHSLDEVIVNHIGVRDLVLPQEVLLVLSEARWSIRDGTLYVEAHCRHPAVHLYLQEQITRVHHALRFASGRSEAIGVRAGQLLHSLPKSASDARLEPERDNNGNPQYELPLLQFRLAHDEIRDLLMGVRLYGDPALAIRELYQNALDACRYRRLRAWYRNDRYEGRIEIRHGIDKQGRHYIECVDNGVGMGRHELENTFSRAGRRFITSAGFLWE